MTLLTILRYPDPRLHTVAKPVAAVDARLRELAGAMLRTMYEAEGIGLAATQVDVHQRLVVIDVSENRDQPLVLINPEIIWASAETRIGEEGCLSVPGIYDGVERSLAVKVRALDLDGREQIHDAEGTLAVCIQHEMDHLMGKVFVQYLSPLKRNRIKARFIKQKKEDERDAYAESAKRGTLPARM
jgi:peptide deformylase